MGEVFPMPAVGDLFTDLRGGDRRMRVSYHEGRGTVVVSLWAGTVCKGTFQLAVGDVARLMEVLSQVDPSGGTPFADVEATATTSPSVAPSPDQTGDVSRSALPMGGVPRVA
ncbi:hypothetical protein [Actinoplanes sp. NBRC 103695]|uniref:hypothetical protein n=1 Tax=Actinoplanes sp. NBRC 103695 TaxID=3032202 RepID=UPI0024A18AB4|nr:hypothetical protein [Actinoplanes sp. NBRC 103695]GLZ00457.1 hypothetical protein Acsp02_77090 [Actinoplanes sp. NBRC 103695]